MSFRIGLLLSVLPLMAADLFSGKWELQANTRGGAAWAQYDKEEDMLVWSNPSGLVAKFRIDGNEYPTKSSQRTVSFRKVDDATLEGTQRLNGQVWQVETMTFSMDGQTRTVVRKQVNANGASELTRTSKRTGGTHDPLVPLVGRWESDWSTSAGTAPLVTIESAADRFRVSGLHTYDAAFDGKEHTVERSPNADTVILRRLDQRTIEQTLKRKGNLVSVTTLSVSDDGKTLTMNLRRQNDTILTSVFTRQMN